MLFYLIFLDGCTFELISNCVDILIDFLFFIQLSLFVDYYNSMNTFFALQFMIFFEYEFYYTKISWDQYLLVFIKLSSLHAIIKIYFNHILFICYCVYKMVPVIQIHKLYFLQFWSNI